MRPVARLATRQWRPTVAAAVGLAVALALAAIAIPRRQHTVTVTEGVSAGAGGRSEVNGGGSSGAATGAAGAAGAPAGAAAGGASAAAGEGGTGGTAAGGSASGSGAGASGSGGSGSAGSAGAVRGVTPTSVRIGVAVLDLSAVKYLGSEYDPGNVQQQWQALLDGWHRQHLVPVNGRDIEFAFQSYSVTSTDEQRSACAGLIDDKKVFAVIGIEFFYQQGSECVTAEKHTPLLTSEGPADDVYTRGAPWLFSLTRSEDSLLRNLVHWADQQGLLRGKKIGVYHLNDPQETALVDRSIKGELGKLGYHLTAEASTSNALGGPDDALAVQQFRTKGVDLAILLTSRGGFMQQAEAQGYKPTYIDTDYGGGTSDVGTNQYPGHQFDGTRAMTTVRRGEPAAGIPPSPDMEPCVRNYERYSGRHVARPGSTGHEAAEWVFIVLSCDEGKVLLQALQTAGPNLTPASLVHGLESIHGVSLIRYPDVTFGPGRHQGVTQQRTLQWHASCTCWRATGQFQGLFVP